MPHHCAKQKSVQLQHFRPRITNEKLTGNRCTYWLRKQIHVEWNAANTNTAVIKTIHVENYFVYLTYTCVTTVQYLGYISLIGTK